MGDYSAWHRLELAERAVRSSASFSLDQFASMLFGVPDAAAESLAMASDIVAGGRAMGLPSLVSPPELALRVVPANAVIRGTGSRQRIGRRGTVPPAAPPVA